MFALFFAVSPTLHFQKLTVPLVLLSDPSSDALNHLRLAQLFFSEENRKSYRHRQLEHQRDPEPHLAKPLGRVDAEIREDASRANLIRRGGSSDHCCGGTEDLGCDEHEEDVEAG